MLAALALLACRSAPLGGAEPDRYLVTVDALRADHAALTPNLRRLAAESRTYARAFSHGVETRTAMAPLLRGTGEAWLARRFPAHAAGAFVSNAWLGPPLFEGFEEVRFVEYSYLDGRPRVDGHDLALAFRRWLGEQDGPVLAWLHFMDVHAPYEAPGGEGRALVVNGPVPAGTSDEALATTRRRYRDGVAWFDAILGEVLDAVDARARPNVLVLTADHGESLGERSLLGHGAEVVPETAWVPLFVRAAGLPAGTSTDLVGTALVGDLLLDPARVEGQAEVPVLPDAVVRWPLLLTTVATFDLASGDAGAPRPFSVDLDRMPRWDPRPDASGRMRALGYLDGPEAGGGQP